MSRLENEEIERQQLRMPHETRFKQRKAELALICQAHLRLGVFGQVFGEILERRYDGVRRDLPKSAN